MLEKPVRLFLADIDNLMYEGVRCICAEQPGWVVVHAPSFEQLKLLQNLQRDMAHQYHDLILLGALPSKQHGDYLAVIDAVITLYRLPMLLIGRIDHGWVIHYFLKKSLVRGYLHKQDALTEILVQACEAAVTDNVYLSWTAYHHIDLAYRARLVNRLSTQDIDVLRYLARGNEPGQVASKMNLTRRRVYTIMARLRELFGVDTTSEMMVHARNCGFS